MEFIAPLKIGGNYLTILFQCTGPLISRSIVQSKRTIRREYMTTNQPVQYMLVMEINEITGRRRKERIFINVSDTFLMTSDYLLDKEISVARRFGINPGNVVTVNVVKLQ